jgi:intracellular septation protein
VEAAMVNLLKSAQLLVSDLASTLLFLAVLLITKDLILAVALGVGLGIIQIGWLMARRKPIDTMQWLSIGLVVVSGAATMLTSDARFVMLKPTVIYCIVGAYMLRPGWMNRYLPPIAVATVPDLAYLFGFIWAGRC